MLVSLSNMKAYLNIDSGNTANDSFLTEQLNLISDTVEAYCQRIFNQTTYTQTFYSADYPKSKSLELVQFPLISVTSITEDGVVLDPSNYRLHKPTGSIVRPSSYFFFGTETVVVYSAGFATIPTIVDSVVKSLVEERYNKKSSGVNLNFGSDVQRISIPGAISIDFDYSLNNNDRKSAFGSILGSHANSLDYFRSERAVVGSGKLTYT